MEPFCGENTPKNTRFGKKYVLKVRGEKAVEGGGEIGEIGVISVIGVIGGVGDGYFPIIPIAPIILIIILQKKECPERHSLIFDLQRGFLAPPKICMAGGKTSLAKKLYNKSYFNPPQGWLFLLAARQSMQAHSALAPQRRLKLVAVA